MAEITNKRFIAGATCPACAGVDKIYTYEREAEKWRACASCDFKEALSEAMESSVQVKELVTRVNQNRIGEPSLAHETPVEAVKLIDSTNREN